MDGVLKEIIDHKREEVARLKAATSFADLEAQVLQAEAPRNFFAAVTQHADPFHTSVIAEVPVVRGMAMKAPFPSGVR